MTDKIITEEQRTVIIGQSSICYTLHRKKVKNLNLRIKPDSSVVVSAPENVSADKIDAFIIRKSSYITDSLNAIRIQNDSFQNRQYVSGEGYRLEGKNLRLKLKKSDSNYVESDGVFLTINCNDINDIDLKSGMIKKFYHDTTQKVMDEILSDTYCIFRKYNIQKPTLKIRSMKTRWGSCNSSKGIITINSQLIEAPRNCIEYVIMHELCHMKHPNHSKQFYTFLSMQMPDWKERKKTLDEYFFSPQHSL